jgi:hypothetical protein
MNEPQVQYDKFTTFVNTTQGKIVFASVIAIALLVVNLLTRNYGYLRMLAMPIGVFAFCYFYFPGWLIKQADKKAAASKKDEP